LLQLVDQVVVLRVELMEAAVILAVEEESMLGGLGVAEAGVLGQPLIRVRAVAHSLVEVQAIGMEGAAQEHQEAEEGGLPLLLNAPLILVKFMAMSKATVAVQGTE